MRDEQSQRRISKYRYLIGIDEGLSYSDYGDEDTPYDVKPTNAVQPMQELASLLNETHLKDLYHATQNDALIKILETDTIKLAFTGGTKADHDINKGKHFFLSTMRSKYGNYARGGPATEKMSHYDVIIHLDGQKLTAAGFKVFHANYWGIKNPESSEQEERIVADQDEMKPIKKFVIDIHVWVNRQRSNNHHLERMHKLNELAKTATVPIYFYTEEKYFKLQKIDKAVKDISQILPQPEFTPDELELKKFLSSREDVRDRWSKTIKSFLKVYYDQPMTNDYPDKNVMQYLRHYHHDAYAQFSAEIHNLKKYHPPIFREIVAILKKEGLTSTKDFVTFLINKVAEKDKRERQ